MYKNNNYILVSVIAFISLLIVAALLFMGLQMRNLRGPTAADIEKGIENYIASQQKEAASSSVAHGDFADDDAFLGDENAPVTLVEFSDFQCPYCRKFYNETFGKIKENYIDTGEVKFVYRDYPLSFHQGAMSAALAAECVRDQAGDDAFFAMHDMIFDGQNKLGVGTVEISSDSLYAYADSLGMNMDEFKGCLENEKFKDEVLADLSDGQALGINGTPGFILDEQIISGAQPYSVFEQALNAVLSTK